MDQHIGGPWTGRLALLTLLLAAGAPDAGAASLEAFAGVVGGAGTASIQNGCTTWGAPAELAFFGSSPLGMQTLGGNVACGYSGGWTDLMAPAAPAGSVLPNSASLAPVLLGNPGFSGSYDGTAAANASYGLLGGQAHGNFTGGFPGAPTALFDAMSAALFTDTLTASSPLVANLSAGTVQYVFHLSGSAAALGAQLPYFFGEARAQLFYQQQGGPVFILPYVDAMRGSTGDIGAGLPLPPGWTASTGAISGGSDFITMSLPMVWGQSWDLKVGFLVWAYGDANADFSSTAQLTGVNLFDANGNAVTTFTLGSASGTSYVTAVPEPAPPTLLLAGLAALALARRRASRET